MKRNQLFVALMSAAVMSSCSSELVVPESGEGQCMVTFTAQLPANLSRAYGDGNVAKTIKYAIYDAEATTIEPLKVHGDEAKTYGTYNLAAGETTATITLQLAQGKKYNAVFWADATEGSPYTFNADDATIVATYTNATSSNENFDAFYGKAYIEVDGAASVPAELTRPFAQLNIGTSDYDAAKAAGYEVTQTAVTVSGVNKTLDLLTGNVPDNESADVEFGANSLASAAESAGDFPAGSNYKYLSMNYVLVGTNGISANVTMTTYNANNVSQTFTYNAVPLKPNYRTNIYGALLTNPVDYNVSISAGFAGTENKNVDVWDGTSKTEPTYNEETNTYEINSASDLAWFADFVNNGGTSSLRSRSADDSHNFSLNCSIDLGGNAWTAIGTSDKPYTGTFNGNGNTISNIPCNLFGVTNGASISNLTVSLSANTSDQELYSAFIYTATATTIDNIIVNGDTYCNAGLVFETAGGNDQTTTIQNCVNNANLTSTLKYAAGFVGKASSRLIIDKCVNNGNALSLRSKGAKSTGFVAVIGNDVTVDITNSVNNGNCELLSTQECYAAGFGCWISDNANSVLNIKNCVNNGNISGKRSATGYYTIACGGFIGNALKCTINIEDSTNNGNIYTENAATQHNCHVGGIIGVVNDGGTRAHLTNVKSNGTLTGVISDTSNTGHVNIGGLVGELQKSSLYINGAEITANVVMSATQNSTADGGPNIHALLGNNRDKVNVLEVTGEIINNSAVEVLYEDPKEDSK